MATAETIDGVVGTYSGEITGGDDGSGYDDGLWTDRNHLRVFSCREFGAQTSVQGRQYDGTGHELGKMLQELGHQLPGRWIFPDPFCGM